MDTDLPFLNAADQVAAHLFAFAAAVAVLNSADELFLDGLWLWAWLSGRLRERASAPADKERPVAIFVPLWHEHAVIGDMLAHNLAAIRYRNYDVFVGCYPNDPLTVQVVEGVSARWPNVHLAMCPHEGPTSKGDCLNWIYQRMLLFEQTHARTFDMVVIHDAEDLIHPDELPTATRDARDDFIQFPVLPLPTVPTQFAHGVYCDEFALGHTRDMTVRSVYGGFLPSAGVGTAFSRRAVEELACADANKLFDPACLTEDYDTGFRLHRLGMRQRFVPLRNGPRGPLATREYFPTKWKAALTQRERWVTGIVFQGWERNGWVWAQAYWLWRDRKGPLVNMAGALSTVLFVYGVASWAVCGNAAPAWFGRAVAAAVAGQVIHLAVRSVCVWRWYGPAMATTVWVRQIYADALNVCAAMAALRRYVRAKWRREPILWVKTAHAYPSQAALTGPQPAIMSSAQAARALPRAVVRKWRLVPLAISAGELQLGAREIVPPAAEAELRRYTSLRIRIHVMSENMNAGGTPPAC